MTSQYLQNCAIEEISTDADQRLTDGAAGLILRFRCGAIAQLGERLHGMQEVRGSIPRSSTIYGFSRVRCRPKFPAILDVVTLWRIMPFNGV